MGGLGVLIVIGVYLAIAYKVVTTITSKKAKYAVMVFFVLLPTADALVGRLYLRHLCATEGGLKVYRVVENVEGFLLQDGTDGHWIKQYGFRFVEGKRREPGIVDRFERVNDEIKIESKVLPKSEYRFRFVRGQDEDIFYRNQATVDVIRTGEVLATYTSYYFLGGWAERFLAGFSDAGPGTEARCEVWQPELLQSQSITAVLKPVIVK